ncbi:unnamed protein product [Echinostoma caproni]|uniref:C2H2-type domain-containing protein n=1 Tax=Echinostoma caproni TaxID=27848 RepID=A0A183AZS5_9TREM|nr:unnamed protein product [Echinostoma caproni]
MLQVSTSVFLAGIGLYGSTQMGECLQVCANLARCTPKPVISGGVNSVGTQYHGPSERSTEARSPSEQGTQCSSAPPSRSAARANSLLEFARFDWSGRPQPTRRQQGQGQTEDTVIHIPSDLSRVAGGNTSAESRSSSFGSDSNSLAVIRTQIESDGSSRVYEICFSCPVKIVRNRRYVIHVQTSHAERVASASSSSTAMNSSSLYIGLFGRAEVRVPCGSDESAAGYPGRHENTRKSRHHHHHRGSNESAPQSGPNKHGQDNHDVVFHFFDNAEGVENGEVDRGFLPELLFYTCS